MFQATVITKTEVISYLSAYYLRNFSTQTYISPRNMMHREMCHRSSLKYICVWRVETRLVERKYELKLKFHRTQKLTACKENFRKMRAIMIIKLFLREVIEFLTLLSCKTGPEGIYIYTIRFRHERPNWWKDLLCLRVKILNSISRTLNNAGETQLE